MLNRKKCLSHCLQTDPLPEEAQAAAGNRVIDCEICQQACPWNRNHIRNPLKTVLTESFQDNADTLKNIFYLPDLVKLTEAAYHKVLGGLNTDIPYEIFHRNVSMAMERAKGAN